MIPPPDSDDVISQSSMVTRSGLAITVENIMPQIDRIFLKINSTIGKYRILSEIDRGGMAVVYKALQLDLDRDVALKVLPANITINRSFVDRFLSEAHAVAHLTHPNIVNIHEVGMEDNVYFLAMDFIAGKNLYYYLHSEKPKLIDVLEIIARLADALSYAHKQKILHRDLKLNNVIMKDRLTPVLIDFGLAKALESTDATSITQPGEIMGSPAYMAPERLLGEGSDARSDICSLGIMLYEMITFKNPYLDLRSMHQTTINVLEASPIAPRKIVPWLPVEIEAITLKAMQADREKRYQTMEELKDDIQRYQRGDPVLARRPTLRSRAMHLVRKRWPVFVIGLLVALFASLLGISAYLQSQKELPRWRLVFEENFDSDSLEKTEYKIISANKYDKENWEVNSKMLFCGGATQSFFRLERPFTRDIRVEFSLNAVEKNFYGAGFFLGGDKPSNGYKFFIHRNGSSACGIQYPDGQLFYSDIKTSEILVSRKYHVVIEKRNHQLSFFLNNVCVVSVADMVPPLGKTHQNIGFFAEGSSCNFDNVKVFRLAIPQVPSPTLVADRFYEHGDFESAYEEYKTLQVDLPNADFANTLRLRMADCQIRLENFSAANDLLEGISYVKQDKFNSAAHVLFLRGLLALHTSNEKNMQDAFSRLNSYAQTSTHNKAAFGLQLNRVGDMVVAGNYGSALKKLNSLVTTYPQSALKALCVYNEIAKRYAQNNESEMALEVLRDADSLLGADPSVMATTRITAAEMYLNRQEKSLAIDALNRCVALPIHTEEVWNSWLILASIYEYDQSPADALTIYRTLSTQCPALLPAHWMALVHIAEIAKRGYCTDNPDDILASVIDGSHPFPFPRLLARFYKDEISEKKFIQAFLELFPNSPEYFWYIATKAYMQSKYSLARTNINVLKSRIPQESWLFLCADRLQKEISNR